MKYTAEIKRYDPDDEHEATFDTWDEAAEWLREQHKYFGVCCGMWVNNDRVKFHGQHLVNDEPFEVPALSVADLLFNAFKPPTHEELRRVLRPVPTNPATRREGGEP